MVIPTRETERFCVCARASIKPDFEVCWHWIEGPVDALTTFKTSTQPRRMSSEGPTRSKLALRGSAKLVSEFFGIRSSLNMSNSWQNIVSTGVLTPFLQITDENWLWWKVCCIKEESIPRRISKSSRSMVSTCLLPQMMKSRIISNGSWVS